jgi:mRNA-degrading endonuclease RelE of RelBE toxin-antitoxin system
MAGWRIRIGDYRVVYEIDDNVRMVTVLHVGSRQAGIYR